MKRITRDLIAILLVAVILIISFQCKKDGKSKDQVNSPKAEKIKDPVLLAIFRRQQEADMKKGVVLYSRKYANGELSVTGSSKDSRGNRINGCPTAATLNITNFSVKYDGNCFATGNYTGYIEFNVVVASGVTLTNSNPIDCDVYDVYNGGSNEDIFYTAALVSSSGNTFFYKKSFSLTHYCTITELDFTVTPSLHCADNSNSFPDLSVMLASDKTNQCKSIAPLSVAGNTGLGTILIGSTFPCSNPSYDPCVTEPDAVEFSYRLSGTTTWTTYTLNPYDSNAQSISPGSTGTYECRWRNKKISGGSCSQPYTYYSDIITVTVT